ncbi:MAG: putative toxin-antitoxin system toxin component, PIN family [Fimbriimonadales bacterium]|nr:MAG: PIN domain-containing protein [Fimbriimonadales bacterium]
MRVVIDTNIWVSAFLVQRGYSARLIDAFRQTRFVSLLSAPLVQELETVLRRPRLVSKYHLEESLIREYIALIREQSVWVEVEGTVRLCRDPRDNFLIETAIFGNADYLVTRDDDLKRAPELVQQMTAFGIQVVSVQQFLNQLGAV